MASKYILQHTAEAIDHKLDLIVENKNLLEYPYDSNEGIPTEFIDVGDGSILVPARADGYADYNITLASFILPAGDYAVSTTCTDLLTDQIVYDFKGTIWVYQTGTGTELARIHINSGSEDPDALFTLSEETSIDVVLYTEVISQLSTDVILRPQLEKGSEVTSWAPYMSTVNDYVDGRFNGLNAKIRALMEGLQLDKLIELADSIEFVE